MQPRFPSMLSFKGREVLAGGIVFSPGYDLETIENHF